MPKVGTEQGAILLRENSLPTLLAICEYTADKMGQENTIGNMIFTINTLKNIFYKGQGTKRIYKGNPYGCKGKPKKGERR